MYKFPIELWDELAIEFDLCDGYSGRGMFGTRCIGLTGQISDLLRFAAACQRTADELDLPSHELLDALASTVRSDSMGLDQIFYFPGIQVDSSDS